MVRPAAFGPNPETAATNSFQHDAQPELGSELLERARRESDELAAAIQAAGVDVCILEDVPVPPKPDACFPNNWISFHPDGTVVLYPMLAPNRRLERRAEDVLSLVQARGYRVTRTVDLTRWERRDAFLEGTGSLILDHDTHIAFAALSPRTCREPLEDFAAETGFRVIVFDALDAKGAPVYHTNVVMSLGSDLAVLCAASIPDPTQRDSVQREIRATGREILPIEMHQMSAFAGNVLWLRSCSGEPLLVVSSTAVGQLRRDQLAVMERHASLVVANVGTIEWIGGGSVRCMLAELYLPRR